MQAFSLFWQLVLARCGKKRENIIAKRSGFLSRSFPHPGSPLGNPKYLILNPDDLTVDRGVSRATRDHGVVEGDGMITGVLCKSCDSFNIHKS